MVCQKTPLIEPEGKYAGSWSSPGELHVRVSRLRVGVQGGELTLNDTNTVNSLE